MKTVKHCKDNGYSCSKYKNKMEEEDKENVNEKRRKSKLNHMLEPGAEGTKLGGPLET